MGRLRRFEGHRWIGLRDTMLAYDCDDGEQFEELQARVVEEELLDRNKVSAFSPDTAAEARNRGFKLAY